MMMLDVVVPWRKEKVVIIESSFKEVKLLFFRLSRTSQSHENSLTHAGEILLLSRSHGACAHFSIGVVKTD